MIFTMLCVLPGCSFIFCLEIRTNKRSHSRWQLLLDCDLLKNSRKQRFSHWPWTKKLWHLPVEISILFARAQHICQKFYPIFFSQGHVWNKRSLMKRRSSPSQTTKNTWGIQDYLRDFSDRRRFEKKAAAKPFISSADITKREKKTWSVVWE